MDDVFFSRLLGSRSCKKSPPNSSLRLQGVESRSPAATIGLGADCRSSSRCGRGDVRCLLEAKLYCPASKQAHELVLIELLVSRPYSGVNLKPDKDLGVFITQFVDHHLEMAMSEPVFAWKTNLKSMTASSAPLRDSARSSTRHLRGTSLASPESRKWAEQGGGLLGSRLSGLVTSNLLASLSSVESRSQ